MVLHGGGAPTLCDDGAVVAEPHNEAAVGMTHRGISPARYACSTAAAAGCSTRKVSAGQQYTGTGVAAVRPLRQLQLTQLAVGLGVLNGESTSARASESELWSCSRQLALSPSSRAHGRQAPTRSAHAPRRSSTDDVSSTRTSCANVFLRAPSKPGAPRCLRLKRGPLRPHT